MMQERERKSRSCRCREENLEKDIFSPTWSFFAVITEAEIVSPQSQAKCVLSLLLLLLHGILQLVSHCVDFLCKVL